MSLISFSGCELSNKQQQNLTWYQRVPAFGLSSLMVLGGVCALLADKHKTLAIAITEAGKEGCVYSLKPKKFSNLGCLKTVAKTGIWSAISETVFTSVSPVLDLGVSRFVSSKPLCLMVSKGILGSIQGTMYSIIFKREFPSLRDTMATGFATSGATLAVDHVRKGVRALTEINTFSKGLLEGCILGATQSHVHATILSVISGKMFVKPTKVYQKIFACTALGAVNGGISTIAAASNKENQELEKQKMLLENEKRALDLKIDAYNGVKKSIADEVDQYMGDGFECWRRGRNSAQVKEAVERGETVSLRKYYGYYSITHKISGQRLSFPAVEEQSYHRNVEAYEKMLAEYYNRLSHKAPSIYQMPQLESILKPQPQGNEPESHADFSSKKERGAEDLVEDGKGKEIAIESDMELSDSPITTFAQAVVEIDSQSKNKLLRKQRKHTRRRLQKCNARLEKLDQSDPRWKEIYATKQRLLAKLARHTSSDQ